MQNTKVQGAINHLFEGHTFNFVECINVEYKSTRKESYMDLQLDVKGCKNVYDSFVKYTEVEMLDGQNQYKAEGHGLQVPPQPLSDLFVLIHHMFSLQLDADCDLANVSCVTVGINHNQHVLCCR